MVILVFFCLQEASVTLFTLASCRTRAFPMHIHCGHKWELLAKHSSLVIAVPKPAEKNSFCQMLFKGQPVEKQMCSVCVLTPWRIQRRHFGKGFPGSQCSSFCTLEYSGFLSLLGWSSHAQIMEGLTVLSSKFFRKSSSCLCPTDS